MPTTVLESIGAVLPRHPSPVVLELDLTDTVVERPPAGPAGRAVARRRVVVRDVVEALRLARDDADVRGLVVRLGGRRFPLATAQELRGAVTAFRAAGKWAIAWSESFGEFGVATVPYYVATAFDQIWLMPTGAVGLVGVGVNVTFLHDALERAGVEVQMGQRHEYKNAANVFTHAAFTPAHREATERIADSTYEQLVSDIAATRGLDPAAVRAAVDEGPLLADEALERGLVDRLGYRDEVYDEVRRRAGSGSRLRYLDRYRKDASKRKRRRPGIRRGEPVVALVHAVGPIRTGRSARGPVSRDSIGSDTVSAALRLAIRDDAVRAIVLRVDSPGGSAVGSDVIWRTVVLAKRAGTPLVVSMGDLAASGGYYISVGAQTIVAHPGTLTGSIGVLGGKPVVRDLLDRLGLRTETVTNGEHAAMFSTRRGYSEGEWERVQRYLDRVYDDFVAKVADGRRMTRAEVHEVARGRVWTGADAHERGLVDHLGGLDLALDIARDHARLRAGQGVVREFPKISPVARLRPPASSDDPAAAAAVSLAPGWEPLAELAASLGLPTVGPLVMPFVPVID